MEITNLVVINPTPNSIHLVQDAISRSTSPYHPWLDPFNVSIGLLGAPAYGIVGLPGLTSGDHVPVHIEQDVQLIDPDAFADYNVALITSQSIQQTITGSTWLHEGSLPATDVSYNKQPTIVGRSNNPRPCLVCMLTQIGFNNLTGLNITQFAISLAPQSDGTNINGTLLIPNPTIITVAMGNVTFNTFVNDTLIGNATIQDFVLKPGNNSYSMRGVTDQVTVLSMLQNNYPSGILPVRIVGNSSIYNGQHLTYYEKALQANTQHLNLNVGAALAAAGINITGGGL